MALMIFALNYNIPRKIRELQLIKAFKVPFINYNIPRKIRELQFAYAILLSIPIITYQEKLGNYNQ